MKNRHFDFDCARKAAVCPVCKNVGFRHSLAFRKVRDLGRGIVVRYSKHWCETCQRHFVHFDERFMSKRSCYTNAFRQAALGLVASGKRYDAVMKELGVPRSTLSEWVCDARIC